MNKRTPTAIQLSTREAQRKGMGVAVVIMVLFGFIAITVQPPLSLPSLISYALLSLALAILYALGTPRYVRYPEKYGMASILPVAILGAGLLLGISLTLWGRVQLYFLLFILIGYALLVYYSKKRYGSLLFLVGMIIFSWLCYGFVGNWETARVELLDDLPWLALMITLAETVVHRMEQQERTAAIAVELGDAHQQLKVYASQIEELAVTGERARLASEIHDSVGHTLTALDVQMELLVRTPFEQSDQRQRLAEGALAMVKTGLTDLRQAVQALRPAALETFSLTEAIDGLVTEFRQMTNTSVQWQVDGDIVPLSAQSVLALYRAAQEALTNIQRHAPAAAQVEIQLAFTPEVVILAVSNNGISGVSGITSGAGFGLRGLRERAAVLGGTFQARPDGRGYFCLEMQVPII